jgi:hypothetical protein
MAPVGPARQIFHIDCLVACGALVRVLGPFSLLAIEPLAVRSERASGRLSIRIETEGLEDAQVQHLRRRLGAMPTVKGVSIGWRS